MARRTNGGTPERAGDSGRTEDHERSGDGGPGPGTKDAEAQAAATFAGGETDQDGATSGASKRVATDREVALSDAWNALAVFCVLIGLIAKQDGLTLLGVFLLVISLVARLWSDRALYRVIYQRRLDPRRAFIGETVEMQLIVENHKLLPMGWLRIEDEWPTELRLTQGEDDLRPSALPERSTLRNTFSLRWYERVRLRYRILCEKRGYYRLGPARVTSGDIFGLYRNQYAFSKLNWLIVYPRVVPIEELGLPPKDPFGEVKARQRIFEDPSRTIGVRDHQPEDGFRRIHWKATARRQELQVKVYEPTTSFTLVVFVNVATFDKYWYGTIPELLERCITVSASVCHFAAERRYVVGMVANGCIPRSDQPIRVLPGRSPDQLTRILEALAAVTPVATQDISDSLTRESPRLPWGATLVVVTANVNEELSSTLLRLHAAGRRLVLISLAKEPPDSLVSEQILTYHLPDAASIYYPLDTSAARQLTPAAERDSVLAALSPAAAQPGGPS
jgi:uncharacterized protein (DUF58 family)